MRAMRPLGPLPSWLRRGLEAGILAALVAVVSLLGSMGLAAGPVGLPRGLSASLILAPAILAIGVFSGGYPVAYAATRSDAILGSITAFVLSADAVTIVVGTRLNLGALDREIPAGLFVALLAALPALVGLMTPQVTTALGFGRRAGAVSVVGSGLTAAIFLLLASRLG
jgi:hypothetical protein